MFNLDKQVFLLKNSLLKKYFEIVGGLSDIIVTNEMIIWSHRKQKHFIKRGENYEREDKKS